MPTRLADGLWHLDIGLVPPIASNAYLVDAAEAGVAVPEGGPVTLVDTGLPVNVPRLRTELGRSGDGYAPGTVDRVLLTHYDLDHTGGLPGLQSRGFEGPVYVGREDARLAAGEWSPQPFHPKGMFHRAVRPFFPLPDDAHRVDEGDEVAGFTAHHTPGHNPGHTVYVHEEVGAAFLGDLVWEEGTELTPPFWLDSYDMHQLRESIRSFAGRTAPFEVACIGHGNPLVEGGDDALDRLVGRL